jgi:hypothetical protein
MVATRSPEEHSVTEAVQHLAQRLEQEGEKSLEFFRALPQSAWEAQVYSTGSGWRVHDILAHFASAERGFHALLEDVLAGGRGAPLGFDIDHFNEVEVGASHGQPVEALLKGFADARASTIELARRLRPEDLTQRGRHPWFGETTIGEMLKLIHRHNQLHQRDIRKVLASGSPLPAESSLPPRDSAPEGV